MHIHMGTAMYILHVHVPQSNSQPSDSCKDMTYYDKTMMNSVFHDPDLDVPVHNVLSLNVLVP